MPNPIFGASMVVTRARQDYREFPGLSLSAAQGARLWGVAPDVADAALRALVDAGVLRATARGLFVRADEHLPLTPEPPVPSPREPPLDEPDRREPRLREPARRDASGRETAMAVAGRRTLARGH